MSLFNPMNWDLDFFLLHSSKKADIKRKRTERIVLAGTYLSVFTIARFWLGQVTKYVPEPYLDEAFHIPQAQAYCRGELQVWDPKLTTPPGLYVISVLLIRILRGGTCTVLELRTIDCLTIVMLLFIAQGCRSRITGEAVDKLGKGSEDATESDIDWDTVHTAVNICLFPPLFFFSGLYYTDVLSTCIVVVSYNYFLKRGETRSNSILRGLATYVWGVMALLMRQTNIFWVAVFMGGMEIVRTFDGKSFDMRRSKEKGWMSRVEDFITLCNGGAFHDPKMIQAGPFDWFWCALSLAVATMFNLRLVAVRLWPYVALLISFGAFVIWNGGVVLGDKSNHVATLHLPQMLYIWPSMTFFSLPLLFYDGLALLVSFYLSVRWIAYRLLPRAYRPLLIVPPRVPIILQKSYGAWLLASLITAVGIIHLNTIIHPFTLADNRHYVFYVFRYTILKHPLVKYALAPIYILCCWLILGYLAGFSGWDPRPPASIQKSISAKLPRSKQSAPPSPPPPRYQPNTSFALIWLISTALSIITAPLVEPRYFILPWVIWRLHLPGLPLNSDMMDAGKQGKEPAKRARDASMSYWAGLAKHWVDHGRDHKLWFETIWYLLISVITGYIFLFKGFEWPQEPGKVQRFLW